MKNRPKPLRKIMLLIAAVCAAPSLAFAQAPAASAEAPAAPPADAPPPAPAAVPPADAEVAPADAVAPAPTLSDVAAKVDGLEEAYGGTKVIVDSLAKIKLSGYIQARLGLHENSAAGVLNNSTATIFDRFYVRRARLKVLYAGTNMEYMLQIDATGAGTVLKDAEASFVDTWTPFNFKLTGGQFKVPFGYEVLQSSGDREMMERSRFIRAFFPNERDRGLRLQASRNWFRFAAAVVNGNFIQDGTANGAYANTDPNGWKDVIGRVGVDFDWLVAGVSGSYGKTLATTLVTSTPAAPATYLAWMRTRVGADVQAYLDVPNVGGLALKGEFAWQNDHNVDATKVADPCNDVSSLGWYALAVQNIGDYLGVVFRVDQYKWNMASDAATCAVDAYSNNPWLAPSNTTTTTYGGGLLAYVSGNLKFSVIGEKVTGRRNYAEYTTPATMPKTYVWQPGSDDDRITFQLQAKF
jgi:hypothetical protein